MYLFFENNILNKIS